MAIFLALVIRTFVLTGYKVPTGSMVPTLKPGDFIFSFRLPYGLRIPFSQTKISGVLPLRGEIVVFTYPEQPKVSYVKRVIGLPGDLIKIDSGRLVVNGKAYQYSEQPADVIADLPNFQMQTVLVEKAPEGERQILHLKDGKPQSFGPLVVPPNEIFLLGDNRDASDDSRYWGTVPMERLEGRVLLIWLSLDWPDPGLGDLSQSRWPQLKINRMFTQPR